MPDWFIWADEHPSDILPFSLSEWTICVTILTLSVLAPVSRQSTSRLIGTITVPLQCWNGQSQEHFETFPDETRLVGLVPQQGSAVHVDPKGFRQIRKTFLFLNVTNMYQFATEKVWLHVKIIILLVILVIVLQNLSFWQINTTDYNYHIWDPQRIYISISNLNKIKHNIISAIYTVASKTLFQCDIQSQRGLWY